MLVSAIITTHKREPYIVERALKSVINQTYRNIEIIVIDDSPVDYEYRSAVKDIVESFRQHNIKYVSHGDCLGACAARNTGLSIAKGEYIGFLDDDDEWLPNKISEQVNAFTSPKVGLVYCGNNVVYESTGLIKEHKIPCIDKNVYENLMYENFIGSTSFPLIKTAYLKAIGGFDVYMQSAQDYDVWLRISQICEVKYVDQPLVLYHFHEGDQITKNPQKKIAGLERIILKNIDYLKTNRYAYWKNYMGLIPWYLNIGNRKEAFSIWKKTWVKAPLKIYRNLKILYSIMHTRKA